MHVSFGSDTLKEMRTVGVYDPIYNRVHTLCTHGVEQLTNKPTFGKPD